MKWKWKPCFHIDKWISSHFTCFLPRSSNYSLVLWFGHLSSKNSLLVNKRELRQKTVLNSDGPCRCEFSDVMSVTFITQISSIFILPSEFSDMSEEWHWLTEFPPSLYLLGFIQCMNCQCRLKASLHSSLTWNPVMLLDVCTLSEERLTTVTFTDPSTICILSLYTKVLSWLKAWPSRFYSEASSSLLILWCPVRSEDLLKAFLYPLYS